MTALVKTYTEVGYSGVPSIHLSDEEYARGLQCFVPACADIVPVDFRNRFIYLARRNARPMKGWWWLGGRMQPHETKEEAALRNLKRETGLVLAGGEGRLKLIAVFDYRFKDRAQNPPMGCHTLGYTFSVELTRGELTEVGARLDEAEYVPAAGLTPFDRSQLVEAGVFPAILDFYDWVFPTGVSSNDSMLVSEVLY